MRAPRGLVWKQGQAITSWWTLRDQEGRVCAIVVVYVDDFMICGPRHVVLEVTSIIQSVWSTSEMTISGPKNSVRFLGMELRRESETEKEITIYQQGYIQELELAQIPEEGGENSDDRVRLAQQITGEVLWVAQRTRPDLAYTTSMMASMCTRCPDQVVAIGLKALGYLQRTMGYGLKVTWSNKDLVMFCDAAYAPQSARSHGGWVVTYGGVPVVWRSGRQQMMTLSTAEAELLSMIDGAVAMKGVESLLMDLGECVAEREIATDSMAALSISSGSSSWRTRHLRIKANWLQEQISYGLIRARHCPGEFQPADMLTKALSYARMTSLLALWRVRGGDPEPPPAVAILQGKSRMMVALVCCLLVLSAQASGETSAVPGGAGVQVDRDLVGTFMLGLMLLGGLLLWEGVKWMGDMLYHEYIPGASKRKLRKLRKIQRATLGGLLLWEGVKWMGDMLYHEYIPGASKRKLRKLRKIQRATTEAIERELERLRGEETDSMRTSSTSSSSTSSATLRLRAQPALGGLLLWEGVKWMGDMLYHEYIPGASKRKLRKLRKIQRATTEAIERELERLRGELLVAGPGLLLGGASKDSPLSAGRALRTGDVGRWVVLPTGEAELICLGRRDRQVKVRGHRLELAEIELVIKSEAERLFQKQVETLVQLEGAKPQQRLIAYLRPPLPGRDASMLLDSCCGRLLTHARPAQLVGVLEWPRTSTGKIDRKLLRPPVAATADRVRQAAHVGTDRFVTRAPRAPVSRQRQKGWQVLRAVLAGAVACRFRPWRMICWPLAWMSWVWFLAPGSSDALFAQDLSSRVPWLLSLAVTALLPRQVMLLAAAFGGWKIGLRRALATPLLWWMGLSNIHGQLCRELEWYSWYLHPLRVGQLAKLVFDSTTDLLRGKTFRALRGKRSVDWDWDTTQRRPRQRPRLEYVWVEPLSEPTGAKESSTQSRGDLPYSLLQLLESVDKEAGCELAPDMALASVFDSLKLTALVGKMRQKVAPNLSLRDALACDTVLDFVKLLAGRSDADPPNRDIAGSRGQADSGFRVREWPYMFSLSVCWALESKEPVKKDVLCRTLQKLKQKHGALRMQLADPPALWDFAMDAAANLSFSREVLLRGPPRRPGLSARILNGVGLLLWTAWPRLTQTEDTEVPVEVVRCQSREQLEQRSAWLLDGRNARNFLTGPLHAILLELPGMGARLHIALSHGLSDGFSGMPLLQDFVRLYDAELAGRPAEEVLDDAFFGLTKQEVRLQETLVRAGSGGGDLQADLGSWALPAASADAFDHFVWLQQATMTTLQTVVEKRKWCCSLDVAVLALIGGALARLNSTGSLHLRFVASARDAPGEGSVVADFADSRDLDLTFPAKTTVEQAVFAISSCVRYRRWHLPNALTDAEERTYINVRPLLQGLSSPSSWHHTTQWPPVEGERNWDRRNIYHALWIMADQVAPLEWVLCLKVRKSRREATRLGAVIWALPESLRVFFWTCTIGPMQTSSKPRARAPEEIHEATTQLAEVASWNSCEACQSFQIL
eukprot:s4711_g1.t1